MGLVLRIDKLSSWCYRGGRHEVEKAVDLTRDDEEAHPCRLLPDAYHSVVPKTFNYMLFSRIQLALITCLSC
jgi:hypothetical protein